MPWFFKTLNASIANMHQVAILTAYSGIERIKWPLAVRRVHWQVRQEQEFTSLHVLAYIVWLVGLTRL